MFMIKALEHLAKGTFPYLLLQLEAVGDMVPRIRNVLTLLRVEAIVVLALLQVVGEGHLLLA